MENLFLDVYSNIAIVLAKNGDFMRAIEIAHTVRQRIFRVIAWVQIAQVFKKSGQHTEAPKWAKRALSEVDEDSDPDDILDILIVIARTLADLGEYQQSLEVLEQTTSNTSKVLICYAIAGTLLENGNEEQAKEIMRTAEKIECNARHFDKARVLPKLAQVNLSLNNSSKAITIAEELSSLVKDVKTPRLKIDIMLDMILLWKQIGDSGQGNKIGKNTIQYIDEQKTVPERIALLSRIAMFACQNGQIELGREAFIKALDLSSQIDFNHLYGVLSWGTTVLAQIDDGISLQSWYQEFMDVESW